MEADGRRRAGYCSAGYKEKYTCTVCMDSEDSAMKRFQTLLFVVIFLVGFEFIVIIYCIVIIPISPMITRLPGSTVSIASSLI